MGKPAAHGREVTLKYVRDMWLYAGVCATPFCVRRCVGLLDELVGEERPRLLPGVDLGKCAARARDQRPLNSDLTYLQAITRLPPAVCLRIVLLRARLAHLSIVRPVSAASSEAQVAGTSLTASVARVDPHPFQPCRAAESSTASDIVFDHDAQRPLIE